VLRGDGIMSNSRNSEERSHDHGRQVRMWDGKSWREPVAGARTAEPRRAERDLAAELEEAMSRPLADPPLAPPAPASTRDHTPFPAWEPHRPGDTGRDAAVAGASPTHETGVTDGPAAPLPSSVEDERSGAQ